MQAIQSAATSPNKCIPNIIPSRIHYTGPTKVSKRYWAPSKDEDGSQTAYFRGRKLRGRAVKLPAKYQGLVLKSTNKTLAQPLSQPSIPQYDEEDDLEASEAEDAPESIKILENISTFDELVVWGHDQTPAADDAFVKNVEEWIKFAEAIHGNSETTMDDGNEENAARANIGRK